jgi:hypothetical protein
VKIQDCHTQLGAVVTPPLEHEDPGDDWRAAKADGRIPEKLWDLYRATRYLSASALAGLATPDARIITVYYARLIRSVKECLLDAVELRTEMRDFYSRQYDPRKPYPHEFDRDASRRHRSAFRNLLVNLVGALDVFADVVAVMLPHEIPRLKAGGAAFTDIEKWLARPHQLPSGLISPAQHFVAELHQQLSSIVVVTAGPERDWLPLMRMYRNKVAHLGHDSYTQFGLESKASDELGFFIPRSWPFVFEQHATMTPPSGAQNEVVDLSDVLTESLMHQDIEEYSDGAVHKINSILDVGFGVLHRLYVQFNSIPLSDNTLEDLERSKQSYKFEYFVQAG